MRRLITFLGAVAAFVAGGALGIALSPSSPPEPEPGTPHRAAALSALPGGDRATSIRERADGLLAAADAGEAAATVPAADLPALVRHLRRSRPPTDAAKALAAALIGRLAAENPRAIFPLVRQGVLTREDGESLRQATGALAEADWGAAKAAVRSLPVSWSQKEGWAKLAELAAGRDDPASFLGEAAEAEPFAVFAGSELFRQWGKRDPVAAAKFEISIDPGTAPDAMNALWSDISLPQALAKEPRFFIDAATSEGISGIWQRLVESAVYQITPEEWEALPPDDRTALEAFAAERNPDALERANRLLLAHRDPEAALAEAASAPPGLRKWRLDEALGEIAKSDPERALGAVLDVPGADYRRDYFAKYSEKFAGDDPASAFGWASDLGDHAARRGALAAAAKSWARHDPAATLDAMVALPPNARPDTVITGALNAAVAENPDAATAAADRLWQTMPPDQQARLRQSFEGFREKAAGAGGSR